MDNKVQILIGIGAAVAVKCQECLVFLVNQAQKNGIDENEIKEVIKIAQRVGLNSAKHMNEFASDLLGDKLEILSIDNGKPCGCT